MSGLRSTAGIAAAARALCEQGAQLYDQAQYDAARARYEQALALLERTTAAGPATTRPALVDRCLGGLGRVLVEMGEDAEAEERLQRLARSAKPGLVRFAAAVALAHVRGAETPFFAVTVLRSAAAQPADLYRDVDLEGTDRAAGEALVVEQARAALSRI